MDRIETQVDDYLDNLIEKIYPFSRNIARDLVTPYILKIDKNVSSHCIQENMDWRFLKGWLEKNPEKTNYQSLSRNDTVPFDFILEGVEKSPHRWFLYPTNPGLSIQKYIELKNKIIFADAYITFNPNLTYQDCLVWDLKKYLISSDYTRVKFNTTEQIDKVIDDNPDNVFFLSKNPSVPLSYILSRKNLSWGGGIGERFPLDICQIISGYNLASSRFLYNPDISIEWLSENWDNLKLPRYHILQDSINYPWDESGIDYSQVFLSKNNYRNQKRIFRIRFYKKHFSAMKIQSWWKNIRVDERKKTGRRLIMKRFLSL